MTNHIYLDHAASTPLDPEVFEAMKPFFQTQFGNASSVHHHGRQLRAALETARKEVADLLNCSPAELVFMSGGTEADNHVIKGNVWEEGIKRIITSPLEHHAVLHAAQTAARLGMAELVLLNVDAHGNLDLDQLEHLLKTDRSPTLVSLMHGNNEIGNVLDLQRVGDMCREYGARFHSDTVQSMANMHLNLQELPVDYIVGSAHKFNGPLGVGLLYCRGGKSLPTYICGGAQERNQRAGTENLPGIIGLATALKKTYGHLAEKQAHLADLKAYMWAQLAASFPGIRQNGNPDTALNSVLNVAFPSSEQDGMLLLSLDIQGVSASGGSACTSGSVKGSHVLEAMGHDGTWLQNSIRFSFGPSNTRQEIDTVLEKLRALLPTLAAPIA